MALAMTNGPVCSRGISRDVGGHRVVWRRNVHAGLRPARCRYVRNCHDDGCRSAMPCFRCKWGPGGPASVPLHALEGTEHPRSAVLRSGWRDPPPDHAVLLPLYCGWPRPLTLRDALYAEWDELGVLGRTPGRGGIVPVCRCPSEALDAFRERLVPGLNSQECPSRRAGGTGPSFLKLTIKVRPAGGRWAGRRGLRLDERR